MINEYKKHNFEYIIISEYDRQINSILISLSIISIFKWLLKNGQYMKCKNIVGVIIISIIHLIYGYFILIFGNINPNIKLILFISAFLSLGFYLFLYIFICLFIAVIYKMLNCIFN